MTGQLACHLIIQYRGKRIVYGVLEAMKQIKDKQYFEKYLSSSKPVKLVGVGFDTGTRKIRDYRIEEVK